MRSHVVSPSERVSGRPTPMWGTPEPAGESWGEESWECVLMLCGMMGMPPTGAQRGCESVPVCLVGMAAGMHCGSVTVITTVRCVFERRRPLWTPWLTLSQHRDANYVLSHLFSCSHQMQRNSLRLKRPAVHIITPYLNAL